MSWLFVYSLTDAKGALTLANFYRLFTESVFLDPLITTFIIATSSALICCAVAAPMGWLVARTDMPLRRHGPRAGDGLVRDAAVPRRHRLGAAGRAEQRPAQPALPRRHRRRAGPASVQHLHADGHHLRHLLLHLPLRVRAGRQRARPHAGRTGGRLLDPRRRHAGTRRGASPSRWCCRRCSPARWSRSCRR